MSTIKAALGPIGAWLFTRQLAGLDPDQLAALGAGLETAGHGALWVGMAEADLAPAAPVLAATDALVYATSILNVWQKPADAARAAYHRLVATRPDRVLLGIGAGHAEFDQRYERPIHAVTGYLDELTGGPDPVPADRVLLAALGPRAIRLAGLRTGGAHPSLTTPEHTARARAALGPDKLLVPEQKVVLAGDPTTARAIARGTVGFYLGLGNYVTNMRRMGFTADDLVAGGSDRLVDAVIGWGTADAIAARVRAHLDAGADHVALQVLTDNGDDYLPVAELREIGAAFGG